MRRIRIFRYLKELDCFQASAEYQALAEDLGITEWNPVVWIGRLFCMDNDFGEHWFDNDPGEERLASAAELGVEPHSLLVLDPDRFQDGSDGPCNPPAFRRAFWKEVLECLELSVELICDKARHFNGIAKQRSDLADCYIPDLEGRIARWRQQYAP